MQQIQVRLNKNWLCTLLLFAFGLFFVSLARADDAVTDADVLGARLEALSEESDSTAALKQADAIVRDYGNDKRPEIVVQVIQTLVLKSALHWQVEEDVEAAVATYAQIFERYGKGDTAAVRQELAQCRLIQSDIFDVLDRPEARVAALDRLIQDYGDDPQLAEEVSDAMHRKIGIRLEADDAQGTILLINDMDARLGASDDPVVRTRIADGLVIKGEVLVDLEDYQEAVKVFDTVIQRFGDMEAASERVAMALMDKAALQSEYLDDAAGALQTTEELYRRYGASDDAEVQEVVQIGRANSVEPMITLGRTKEALAVLAKLTKQVDNTREDVAILTFLTWLADGKTKNQTVLKAIDAAEEGSEFNWNFTAMRRHLEKSPAQRRHDGLCFADFFEQVTDRATLAACLNKKR